MRGLWNLFCHDLSAHTLALPDPGGRYRSDRLDKALLGRRGWGAWLMAAGVHPIGFAVARALDLPIHVLCSFFIVKPARRGGLGRHLARSVMTGRPGTWSIPFQDANPVAARFWPSVASSLDPAWTWEHRPVPDRPDLPPDNWITLTVPAQGGGLVVRRS